MTLCVCGRVYVCVCVCGEGSMFMVGTQRRYDTRALI